jgi:hypothetical protein
MSERNGKPEGENFATEVDEGAIKIAREEAQRISRAEKALGTGADGRVRSIANALADMTEAVEGLSEKVRAKREKNIS